MLLFSFKNWSNLFIIEQINTQTHSIYNCLYLLQQVNLDDRQDELKNKIALKHLFDHILNKYEEFRWFLYQWKEKACPFRPFKWNDLNFFADSWRKEKFDESICNIFMKYIKSSNKFDKLIQYPRKRRLLLRRFCQRYS